MTGQSLRGKGGTPTYAERFGLDQRRWQTCPVCFGRGQVQQGFYGTTTGTWFSGGTATEPCRSCGGRGIVR